MDYKPIDRSIFLGSSVLTSPERSSPSPGPASWSSDKRLAYYDFRHDNSQLFVFDVKTQKETRWTSPPFRAMTGQRSLIDRTFAGKPVWSPDDKSIAIVGSNDKEEPASIYLIYDKDEMKQLTRFSGEHRNPVWGPQGKRIAFVSYRDGKDDLWITNLEDGSTLQLIWDRYDNFDPRWSPDGKKIAYTSQRSDQDPLCCQICLLEVDTGDVEVLTEGGRIHSRFPRWSPDGEGIFFLSDRSGFDEVWKMSPETKNVRMVTEPTGQDKGQFEISPDGRYIAYSKACSSNHDMEILDLNSGKKERVEPRVGVYMWPDWEDSSNRIASLYEGPDHPPNTIIYNVKQSKLEASTESPYSVENNVKVEEVSFESFDKREIEGVLYSDPNYETNKPRPAILYVHGGPNARHKNGWWPFLRYVATKGYVILAPNCRGSTGYGREFMDLNIKDWGGKDRLDWLHAVEFLSELETVDEDRIGLWGRSYGGYATVRGLSKHPDVFKAGICHFGPVDLTSFFGETRVRDLMVRFLGLPAYNSDVYKRCSPSEDLDRITSPLLVLQGEEDDGVPKDQSETLVKELDKLNKTVFYASYSGEGHGFNEPDHIYDAAGRIVHFWESYL